MSQPGPGPADGHVPTEARQADLLAIGDLVVAYGFAIDDGDWPRWRALFTDDAEYRTAPWRDPWRGVDEIVENWLERRDEPDTYTFRWEVLDASPRRHFVRGETTYLGDEPSRYSNLWIVELAPDGRARGFTEWWMNQASTS